MTNIDWTLEGTHAVRKSNTSVWCWPTVVSANWSEEWVKWGVTKCTNAANDSAERARNGSRSEVPISAVHGIEPSRKLYTGNICLKIVIIMNGTAYSNFDNQEHVLKLGETFEKQPKSAFHTVRCKWYLLSYINMLNYYFKCLKQIIFKRIFTLLLKRQDSLE